MNDDIIIQLEATDLYDLVCKTMPTDTHSDKVINKFYLSLLTNPDTLREFYPYYWARRSFAKEISYVLSYLQHNDPNGDWDTYDVIGTPMLVIETLEAWKQDLEDAYEDVPGWLDACIDILMLFNLI